MNARGNVVNSIRSSLYFSALPDHDDAVVTIAPAGSIPELGHMLLGESDVGELPLLHDLLLDIRRPLPRLGLHVVLARPRAAISDWIFDAAISGRSVPHRSACSNRRAILRLRDCSCRRTLTVTRNSLKGGESLDVAPTESKRFVGGFEFFMRSARTAQARQGNASGTRRGIAGRLRRHPARIGPPPDPSARRVAPACSRPAPEYRAEVQSRVIVAVASCQLTPRNDFSSRSTTRAQNPTRQLHARLRRRSKYSPTLLMHSIASELGSGTAMTSKLSNRALSSV